MIKITISVSNISDVLLLYDRIRVYYSDAESGTYTYADSIPLQTGVSEYYYYHCDGDEDTWYKSSYYNSTTGDESSLSNASRGSAPALYNNITYPEEYEFTADEDTTVRKIRRLIGDLKQLSHLYVDSNSFCTYVLNDEKTIDLKEKGWPVYIKINDTEYTSSSNPYVQGYRYLTFSDTLNSGVQNDTIEIWYHTFKFSDREIYEAYIDVIMPPGLSSSIVNKDHLIIQTAIDLLENMWAEDMVDDGASVRDDQTLYDPSPGLRERDKLIARLKKRLQGLIDESIKNAMLGMEGVLID